MHLQWLAEIHLYDKGIYHVHLLGKQTYKVGFSNEKPEASDKCAIKDYDLSLPVRPLEPDKVWAPPVLLNVLKLTQP